MAINQCFFYWVQRIQGLVHFQLFLCRFSPNLWWLLIGVSEDFIEAINRGRISSSWWSAHRYSTHPGYETPYTLPIQKPGISAPLIDWCKASGDFMKV